MNSQNLTQLQKNLNYNFHNPKLLENALIHRSCLNEHKDLSSNERLEFLGDAVLELVISDFLYTTKPNEPEGILTAARSAIVKTQSLASIAQGLNLGHHLIMSRGEENTGGRNNISLLANTTEAVIGAIYLDGGFDSARKFISEQIIAKADKILENQPLKDNKSRLQEIVQKQGFTSPTYHEISAVGPDHDKTFTVEVRVGDKPIAQGIGKNKQEAEQLAAKNAINLL